MSKPVPPENRYQKGCHTCDRSSSSSSSSSSSDAPTTRSRVRCLRCALLDDLLIKRCVSTTKSESSCCSICMVDFEEDSEKKLVINELPCKHYFHKDCISGWLIHRYKSTCPVCRYQLPGLDPPEDGGLWRVTLTAGVDYGRLLLFDSLMRGRNVVLQYRDRVEPTSPAGYCGGDAR